jgi:ankyrin repeat protein
LFVKKLNSFGVMNMPFDTLHLLVAQNNLEGVKKLLKQTTAAVNQPASKTRLALNRDRGKLFSKGNLPLEIAMVNNCPPMAKLLVINGADPNIAFQYVSEQKMSAFSLACLRNDTDLVLYFLQHSKFEIAINQKNIVRLRTKEPKCDIIFQNISVLGITCLFRNLQLVEILLQHNADIHQIFLDHNNNEFTPLALVSLFGCPNPEIIELLCRYQVNINQPLKWGKAIVTSALTVCISSPYMKSDEEIIQVLEYLVNNGADIHREINSMTPLIVATVMNKIKIIDWLINKGVRVNQQLTTGLSNMNALMYACTIEDEGALDALLRHGADINSVGNEYGDNNTLRTQITPLILAADSNHTGIVVKLLMRGADAYFMADQNVNQNPGRSVLLAALDSGDDQILKIVLQHIKKTDHENKIKILSHALTYACNYYSVTQVNMLLDLIDPNIAGPKGSGAAGVLPLISACINRDPNVVKALLQRNAAINAANPDGKYIGLYPLFVAVAEGRKNIIKILHQHGANPRLKITNGYYKNHNCFSILGILNNPELLEYLLRLYPEIQPEQIEGYSPLLCAILTDNVRVVEVLLHNNSNVIKHFIKGDTPLSLAIELGHTKIVKLLLANTDLNVNDYFQIGQHAGRVPLVAAILSRKALVARELINNGADPFKKCNDNSFLGINAWQVAINLCDDEQQPDFLLAILTKRIDAAEQKRFLQLTKNQKLTALFSAVLMENITLIDLILLNMDKSEHNAINKIMSFGIYAGESPLAAAAFLAGADILRKFMRYDCDWNKVILSERIQNKSIFQIVQEKIQDSNFNFVLLVHLREIKQKNNFAKRFSEDKTISDNKNSMDNNNVSTTLSRQSVNDLLIPVTSQMNFSKNKCDLGELIARVVNKHDRKKEYEYYIYYADDHLNAIEDLLVDLTEINVDNNQPFNNDLKLNLLKYHLLRLFQALYFYGQRVQNNELLSANLCWSIRNLLMHCYADLSDSQIYQLGQYAKDSLASVIQAKKRDNPVTISFGLFDCHQKNTSSFDADGNVIFLNWLSEINSTRSNLQESVEYYITIISCELTKIKSFLTVIDSSYKAQIYISNVTALKMSLVHIGEAYQQLNKINKNILENGNDFSFLEDCKEIRDIVGHEFNDDFHFFADNIDPAIVLRVAKTGLSNTEYLQQLSCISSKSFK